jgi:hypothetical protein
MSEHKIVYETLEEIVDFISATHTHLNAKNGIYCLKLWRRPDGTRIPIEEMMGVRIQEMVVYNKTTLILRQTSHGTLFKGSHIHSFNSTLYLPDLAMVNVYDYAAEFWTTMGMDVAYLEQTKEAKTVMLAEWIHDIPRNLRAQWFKDDETEDLLGDVGLGPKITRRADLGRNLDLTEDL